MKMDRRTLMTGAAAAGFAAPGPGRAEDKPVAATTIRRIATEEAWSIPEHLDALAEIGKANWNNLDAELINPLGSKSPSRHVRGLLNIEERLAEMDRLGIDMHLLGLTSPGVQMFDADFATNLAALANDRLAEVVQRHPTRFAGLGTFAPQDPKSAAKEMERACKKLKLNGFIINSHTNNEYLDEEKFWPILEAANDLGAPIYIHPRSPSDGMAAPFRSYRIQSAFWGYAIETGTHAIRMMVSGVFDRFPNLQIVLGHMGENVPFHIWRTDHWYERRKSVYASEMKPSEILKRNFTITTSGVEHGPALRYAIDVLGVEKVMWAIDSPYEFMEPSVKFMNSVELTDAERRAVFHENAERVFAIPSI